MGAFAQSEKCHDSLKAEDMLSKLINLKHLFVILGFLAIVPSGSGIALSKDELVPPIVIAHAGGAIKKMTYTNSLEALSANYDKGFRFFEIDLSWTSDGELVAIHDWEGTLQTNFLDSEKYLPPFNKKEFLKLQMKSGLTQLSLEDVLRWARTKEDAYIITDAKNDNIKVLLEINKKFAEWKQHVIPQVYNYMEYEKASLLGYPQVILTIYRMKIDPIELLTFALRESPFAVTMPWQAAQSGLAFDLYRNNIRVYAHTVNEFNHFLKLKRVGVFGVYTDYLAPP